VAAESGGGPGDLAAWAVTTSEAAANSESNGTHPILRSRDLRGAVAAQSRPPL
jgi:hypothetical protein